MDEPEEQPLAVACLLILERKEFGWSDIRPPKNANPWVWILAPSCISNRASYLIILNPLIIFLKIGAFDMFFKELSSKGFDFLL